MPLLIRAAEEALGLGAGAEAASYFATAAGLAVGQVATRLLARAEDARLGSPVGGR
jgi:hypothetical protein